MTTLRWFLGLGGEPTRRVSHTLRAGGLAVLAVVGSLGGLCLMPALAATVRTEPDGRHLVRRWWASMRAVTPALWRWQAAFVVAVTLGLLDVAYASGFDGGAAPLPAQAAMIAGVVLVLVPAVLAPLLASVVAAAPELRPAGRVLAAACSLALATPWRTLGVVALTLLTGLLAATAWPLAPLALGALAVVLRTQRVALARWAAAGVPA
ncbi:hypothetical protein Bcav_1471 [Beutenbergia cavernae DSM 12333]|uniref:Uncharacterized protein n=1 Tax=Beutenbergia cavernae (strain ATCC BAA-8 / DSM 12333 / CCUG 43141 / JCM 11478 / NBRC 16432 / NCIMB 13614 / HKI 0122) TaxID=471853 RepID=C5C2P3_BEUC1|nr:hypothetical protein [Beutenbergia cavernae]ACQ79729.1 hypothetical protein Bcav_1471 [Beutenbergia cavernae DSM 12333]